MDPWGGVTPQISATSGLLNNMLFVCGTKLMYSNIVDIKVFKNKKREKHTHIFLICFPKINSNDNIAQKKKKKKLW